VDYLGGGSVIVTDSVKPYVTGWKMWMSMWVLLWILPGTLPPGEGCSVQMLSWLHMLFSSRLG
jgi:hypothetical protein